MPKLTEPSKAIEMLLQSMDHDYYTSVWRDQQRAWGDPVKITVDYADPAWCPYGDRIVKYPSVQPVNFEEGKSPRLMSATDIVVSRFASKEPSFEFQDLTAPENEIRRNAIMTRMRGEQGGAEWFEEAASAFADGDAVGTGVLEIGLVPDAGSGEMMCSAQHVPILDHFWDRWHASPVRTRWSGSSQYLSPEEAASIFGWKAVKPHIRRDMHEGLTGLQSEYVRAFSRYDVGYGKGGDPTVMIWIGPVNATNRPIVREVNKFGIIPNAYAVNTVKGLMMRAVGRIFKSRSDAEMIHTIERIARNIAENGQAMDIIVTAGLNPDDVNDWQEHRKTVVRADAPFEEGSPPFLRKEAQEVSASLWKMLQYYEQRLGDTSGLADLDRASSGTEKTATQIAEEANRLNMNMTWTVAMMGHFQRRQGKIAVEVMKHDKAPVWVPFYRTQVLLNQRGVRMSMMERHMAKPSRLLVDTAALTIDEDRMKKAMRLTGFDRIAQIPGLVGQVIDPVKFTVEYLTNLDIKDAESWITMAARAAMTMDPEQAKLAAMQQGAVQPGANVPALSAV